MKRNMRYAILGAIIIIVAVVVVVIVWRARQAAQPEEVTRSAIVERGTMLVAVSASGSIEPQARVNLAFEMPGRVAEVAVEVGDVIETGDVLARLDTAQLALQVQQAQAALAAAEAQLAQIKAGARPEEIAAAEANLRAVEAQVSGAAANRDQLESGASDAQIAAAEADLASAVIQQRSAKEAHDTTMKCYKMPDGSEKCPLLGKIEEQARYNLDVANKTLTASQARLDELLAGADPDQLRATQANVWAAAAQRDAAQAQLDLLLAGATEGQIAAAEAQVAQARVALELAELALEKATLRAPFDGVVAAVNVTTGEMAPTGLPASTLLDISRFRITVGVDEMDVGLLAPGQTAQVTLDAFPDIIIDGTVERIAPAATILGGVVYYDVVIELAPTDAPIRADMTVNTTIVVEELTDVLVIPTWVVRVDRGMGQTYVNRQVGAAGGAADQIERVDVELGVRHEGVTQVLNGLSEGDKVVWVQESTLFDFGP